MCLNLSILKFKNFNTVGQIELFGLGLAEIIVYGAIRQVVLDVPIGKVGTRRAVRVENFLNTPIMVQYLFAPIFINLLDLTCGHTLCVPELFHGAIINLHCLLQCFVLIPQLSYLS